MTVGSIPGMGSISKIPGPVLSYDRGNDGRCPYISEHQDVPSPVQYESAQTLDPATRGYPADSGPAERWPGVLRN
jgi:hypothetical protein